MTRPALTRAEYAALPPAELERRLRECRDRMGRAETIADTLHDAFTEQELCAALIAMGVEP